MKIVVVGPLRSSFVKVDIRILKELGHDVRCIDSILGFGWQAGLTLCILTIKLLWEVLFADVLYCWFADYHTAIPVKFARILGKKAIVVAGGFDVGYLPDIGYGARTRPKRWWAVSSTFTWASRVLPVSEYARRQLSELTNGNHAPATVVYNAVPLDMMPSDIEGRREPLIVTVTQGTSKAEYIRKGTDRFIAAARRNPGVRFMLVGIDGEALACATSDAANAANLTIVAGFVSLYETILPIYLRATAYMQLSIEETFGVAPVEAMACGCIPIVSNGGALPEIVGTVGYICTNDMGVDAAVAGACASVATDRHEYRSQAASFTLDRRKRALAEIV